MSRFFSWQICWLTHRQRAGRCLLILLLLSFQGQVLAEVDRVSLFKDLTELASPDMEGRATATPGNEKARHYLVQRLRQIGAVACQPDYLHSFQFSIAGQSITGHNIIACLPAAEGTDPARPALLLSAHYDHLGRRLGKVHPGADDNASGVAAILELARQIALKPLNHPVILAFFDAEELGLRGSWAYVNQATFASSQLAFMMNLDMVGRGEKGELYASGAYHFPALLAPLQQIAAQAEAPALRLGHDRPEQGEHDWTTQSDHYPFFRKGVPYLYFGVEDHADYHGPGDTADKIPADFYYATVQFLQRLTYRIDADLAAGTLRLAAKSSTAP